MVTDAQPEPATISGTPRPRTRGIVSAVAVGILAGALGVVAAALVGAVSEEAVYAPVLGAVVVAIWLAGGTAGIAAVVTGWLLGLWLVTGTITSRDDWLGWAVSLATGIAIASIALLMRRGHERTADAADRAERSRERVERLQELAALLSAALTPGEVARVMVEGVPAAIGSRGGALGLIEGDELVIVDPVGARGQTLAPGSRVPLTSRAPITTAARSGRPAWAKRRREFVAEFPDGAVLAPYASGALAVPVFVGGRLVGAMGFPFVDPDAVTEEIRIVARIAAELGGQALERAELYTQERTSRESLDRILAVAPRFLQGTTPESVVASVCAEARRTFDCDIAQVWTPVDGGQVEVTWRSPPSSVLAPGTRIAFTDFPGLEQRMGELSSMFVANAQEHTKGEALRHARKLGLFSSLRVPIVIGARFERILVLQWERIIPEPASSTIAVIRRFADQAGLAIEQADRRRAQELTRALQRVTEALAAAATPAEVGLAIVRQGVAALGAGVAAVYSVSDGGDAVELVASEGHSGLGEAVASIPMASDDPVTRAVRERETILHSPAGDASRAASAAGSETCLAVPLIVAGRVVGAISIGWVDEPERASTDMSVVVALARQAAQALDRAKLFEREQATADRLRKLQAVTAALSKAVSTGDVCRTCLSHATEGVGARRGLVVLRDNGMTRPVVAAAIGLDEPADEVPASAVEPIATCVKRGTAATADTGWIAFPLASGALALQLPDARQVEKIDQEWLETLVSQGAQALDRASRYETERRIAETLQRSVLPERLPDLHGIELAARYLPGTDGLDVGGDWYDAIPLGDGRVALVVGDVVGKGVQAASLMSQLRNALRAFASEHTDPHAVVSRLCKLVEGAHEVPFATLVYLVIDIDRRRVQYVIAGHPPPLIRDLDGATSFLEGGRALPVGVDSSLPFDAGEAELAAGSAIVLYTDGLVERRDRPIDEGMRLLADSAGGIEGDPEELVDLLVEAMLGADERPDDVALVALRFAGAVVEDLVLVVPATQDGLVEMRHALRAWLASGNVRPDVAADVVLAVWEAGANAIEHAQLPTEPSFAVTAKLDTAARLRIEVRDSGGWKPSDGSGERGLGLGLMASLMGRVHVDESAGGTTVVLERRVDTHV